MKMYHSRIDVKLRAKMRYFLRKKNVDEKIGIKFLKVQDYFLKNAVNIEEDLSILEKFKMKKQEDKEDSMDDIKINEMGKEDEEELQPRDDNDFDGYEVWYGDVGMTKEEENELLRIRDWLKDDRWSLRNV